MVKRSKRQLQSTIDKARKDLHALEAAERLRANRKLVGKCFIYRNCHSCPQGEGDYWTMYARVKRLREDGSLVVLLFDVDKDGNFRLDPCCRHIGPLEASYVPIPRALFEEKAREAVAYVRGLLLPDD